MATMRVIIMTTLRGGVCYITLIHLSAYPVFCGDSQVVIPTSSNNSRHVGSEILALSQYAQYGITSFYLTSNDCVCQPCYKDFKRNHNKENTIPRWAKLKHEHYQQRINKHCMYCCDNECRCNVIHNWGPDEWHDKSTTISTWKKYLSLTGKVNHAISSDANHLCKVHYRRVVHLREQRACSACNSRDSLSWKLVCDITSDTDNFCEVFRLNTDSIPPFGWICQQCSMCYADDTQLEDQLTTGSLSHDPITSQKSKLLLATLEVLKQEGVVFTKDIITKYRVILQSLPVPHTEHNRLCETLIKYLCSLAKKHQYKLFVVPNSKILGRALYDEKKFSIHSMNFIFKLKEEEWKKEKSWISIDHLNALIRNQIALFPVSKEFDYTSIISKESTMMELDKYFDSELFDLINSITTSKSSQKHPSSQLYKDLRKARIRMAIGLLCFTMNPQCCFLQTITGLLCYAYGLRDKGFEALNALGCCCSIDHIRSHGSLWAGKRQPIQHLDGTKQWRITIDNLNFHIKYAKNLPESATGSNKMLNLLTCQVSHQTSCSSQQQSPFTLKQQVNRVLRNNASSLITRERDSLTPGDFEIDSNEGYYLRYFLAVCHSCTLDRLPFLPTNCTNTFIEAVQGFMPHWTPIKKDSVVYANIDEALSGSIADVEAYLVKIKRDLHIGKPGYPKQITMAGDQQTYALMKELQRKHPDHYNWMTVLHGDWHTLQLLAEMIRDILWDGGFKQLCFECGHKKMPTQWQEIHMLLIALYQSLLHKAMCTYNSHNEATPHGYKKFWDWLTKIASDSNQDQNSRFWARMLPFLNGYFAYFIAVRSGNWVLRNAAIKTLAPLFFAYNHYKYEELASTAIVDTLTIPSDILKQYLDGGWTVSVKGRPHHNIALDEAHESLINLRLKTITSRPSHFRTVEMSNFMSYLDQVVRGMEELLYRHKQNDPVESRKRYVCQRVTKMNSMLEDVSLFEHHEEETPLSNFLCPNKASLDSKSILDLMNIATFGRDRMLKYVGDYVLQPITTGPRKRRKRARKLATFSKKSSTATESKRREEELTNIAKNAMQILQANGITAQTSPYPLAISDLEGNLRDSGKSKFFETLKKCLGFDQAVTNTCELFTDPVPADLCIVIDMLYYVHMPPPVTVLTFEEHFQHLWRQTVGKFAIQKNASHIYLVFDKPNFLPPPRSIVHKSRRKRAESSISDPTIKDEAEVPHGNVYTSVLANSTTFKQQFLKYLTLLFKSKATSTTEHYNFQVTIDSPSLASVITISNGTLTDKSPNEHGEADFAIWYHSITDTSRNIVIVSCDTDTWMYGIGLYAQGYLEGKNIFVQRGNNECYINIRAATLLLSQHPKLSAFAFPALSIVALYILTGCDYVSSFYRCSKTCFLETLIRDASFVCPDGNLLKMINNEFQYINEQSWIRLVSAVYYSKFKTFFRSKLIGETFTIILKHPDSPEAKRMLSAIQHSSPASRTNQLVAWHEFIRKVTYHVPKVTKYHEYKLVPSYKALLLHCRRATYILKLTMSCPWPQSPFLLCFKQFGWHEEDGTILISWDESTLDSDSEEDLDSISEQSDSNSDSSAD